MSVTGPVEPGDGTEVRRAEEGPGPLRALTSRYRAHGRRHRRTALVTAAARCALTAGGYLYASRPQPRPAPPPSHPSQMVRLACLAPVTPTGTAPTSAFGFPVALTVRSGPPVTVTRVTQPSAGLSVISSPAHLSA